MHCFRWTFDVTFSDYMYKFACRDKFGKGTFSINCVIKDLGWCQSMELYLVTDIYRPDCPILSSEIVRNIIQLKMIEWRPPSLTSSVYYKCILQMS